MDECLGRVEAELWISKHTQRPRVEQRCQGRRYHLQGGPNLFHQNAVHTLISPN